MKFCTHCNQTKPFTEFYWDKTRQHYKNGCRTCWQARARASHAATPGRHRRAHLKRYYGMTPEDYADLLTSQNDVCAICGKSETKANDSLSVDHDHRTGKVRGLLCSKCNKAIGLLGDTAEALFKAAAYLARRRD